MMRAFRAVAAGPISPGDYPAIRSSSAAIRALVDEFVLKLDLIVNGSAHALMRTLRLETYPQGIGMKPRSRVVMFRAPEPWVGDAGVPMKMDPVERRAPRRPFPCLVPGCTSVGAPIYGMVCVEHRKTPKRKIARLRADRKAARGK